MCARHITVLTNVDFYLQKMFFFPFPHLGQFEISWHQWMAFTEQSEVRSCRRSPHFLRNQMMCASCHMNTVCKQCDQMRPCRQWKGKRKRPPEALLLLTSPAIFSLKLFSGLPLVLGPRARGWWWMPSFPFLNPNLFPTPLTVRPASVGVDEIKNDAVWRDYSPAVTRWLKFSIIFDSIYSPQHTDGRLTGREGEDRWTDAQAVGRLHTSLTVPVTLLRRDAGRLEMQAHFYNYRFWIYERIDDEKGIIMFIFSHSELTEYQLQQKHIAALAWDASCERSRCSSFGPDSSEEDNSELRVGTLRWPGAASREKGQAGSLPSLVQMARACWRIMGGITSFPAVQNHRASQTNVKNNGYRRLGLFLQFWGPKSPRSCRPLHLPPDCLLTGGAVNPRSHSSN